MGIWKVKGFIEGIQNNGKLSNGILSDSLYFYIDTHIKWRESIYHWNDDLGYVFFKLLVNIGLDSDPGGAQQFVSRWFHLCSGTHPYPPGWQSEKTSEVLSDKKSLGQKVGLGLINKTETAQKLGQNGTLQDFLKVIFQTTWSSEDILFQRKIGFISQKPKLESNVET